MNAQNLTKAFLVFAVSLCSIFSSSYAQGIYNIFSGSDYDQNTPLVFNLGTEVGSEWWNYDDAAGGSSQSMFIRGGAGIIYAWTDQQTSFNIEASGSGTYYFDDVPGQTNHDFYSGRLKMGFQHRFNERLTVSNQFYLSYEYQPDFGTGTHQSLFNGQYWQGYNQVALNYAWTERFSTSFHYTLYGVLYDEDLIAETHDRWTHIFGVGLHYKLNDRTLLTGEYRYGLTDYTGSSTADTTSHYALAGLDYAWSERTSVGIRVGAEFRTDPNTGTAPYLEANLRYRLAQRTSLNWFHYLGYDDQRLASYDRQYAYRTGAQLQHQFTDRLSIYGSLAYSYTTRDSQVETLNDVNEHGFSLNLGSQLRVWSNLSLTANYGFSIYDVSEGINGYHRHQLSIGLNAQF